MYVPGQTLYFKFTTRDSNVPYTLAGSPVVSVYKNNSTAQSTSGVTLTADFDSVTGLNHVTVDTSSDGTFYSAGGKFHLVITTGTVNGNSVVGEVVGEFYLEDVTVATVGADARKVAGTNQTAGDLYAALAIIAGYIDTEVSAIKAKTDQLTFTTSNKVDAAFNAAADLPTAAAEKLADVLLRRHMDDVEASSFGDTLSLNSLYGAIQQGQYFLLSGTTLYVYKTDGTTVLGSRVLARDCDACAVVSATS